MANWKSKSDTELWWSNQPGNRGRTYPGDDIAEKQYQRNKAAGENNASIVRSLAGKLFSGKPVDLGETGSHPVDTEGAVMLKQPKNRFANPVEGPNADDGGFYKKGGKAKSAKKKSHPNW